MAWIESHQSLAKHPKMFRCSRALGISRPTMVGHLHYLWWWALDFAEDGDLGAFSNIEIAEAAEWAGDPDVFCQALMDVNLLSFDRRIHDWEDYAGRLVTSRKRNRDRQRAYRLRHANVTVTSPLDNGATVPNPTVPNPTVPPPKSPAKRGTHKEVAVTPEFIETMVTEWSPKLGGEERTREVIAEALNHKAMDKRKDKRLYLRGWLRREQENVQNANGQHPQSSRRVEAHPPGYWDGKDKW